MANLPISSTDDRPAELKPVLEELTRPLKQVMLIGVIVNLLSLAPSLYMLEVYERVVNSRNHSTLTMLTVLVLGMYLLMGVMEWVRGQMLRNAGLTIESRLGQRVFNAAFAGNLRLGRSSGQALHELRSLREFLSAPALTALMDAPLALVFLVLIFLINPALGWFSLGIAAIQVYLAYLTERSTQQPLTEAIQAAAAAQQYASGALRNAQVVEAMGMMAHILGRWMAMQKRVLHLQAIASDHAGSKGAAAKLMQNILSSGLLGLGCWLLLQGELAGGGSMMIIASIIGGKALAPLVQVIGSWRTIIQARDAYQRLDKLLEIIPHPESGMPLPPPAGLVSVEAVVAAAPGSQLAILRGVSFTLPAGKALVIVGPSAAGKSTLARLLVGIWPALNGKVRLDGVDIFQWNKTELGPHVGYLPQSVELFDGTVAENIARFGAVDQNHVEAAARAVGLHETILALPGGYEARVGDDGCFLSGGQRQRLGLARAVFGNPRYVVLDEPNSSLDEAGEAALLRTLMTLKAGGTTLVIISHRPSVLPVADAMLLLRNGLVAAFGPRDEVLAALAKAKQSARLASDQNPLASAA